MTQKRTKQAAIIVGFLILIVLIALLIMAGGLTPPAATPTPTITPHSTIIASSTASPTPIISPTPTPLPSPSTAFVDVDGKWSGVPTSSPTETPPSAALPDDELWGTVYLTYTGAYLDEYPPQQEIVLPISPIATGTQYKGPIYNGVNQVIYAIGGPYGPFTVAIQGEYRNVTIDGRLVNIIYTGGTATSIDQPKKYLTVPINMQIKNSTDERR